MWARFLGALGLRGRIIGVVLIASVATLGVAALALLGPLEHSLKTAELTTLENEVGKAKNTSPKSFANTVKKFEGLDPLLAAQADLPVRLPTGGAPVSGAAARKPSCRDADSDRAQEACLRQQGLETRSAIFAQEQAIRNTTNSTEVAIIGSPDNPKAAVYTPEEYGTVIIDRLDDVGRAFRTNSAVYSIGTIGDTQYARAALPFTTSVRGGAPERWVLIVRKPLDTVNAAVSTVRRAFLYAALAGLALALLLGIPLSATIVRRLRRLRHAALQLAADGPPVAVPDRPPPRRGGRSRPGLRPDAAAPSAAGGGAPGVRLDRVARAAHAARLARRDARAAPRRPGERRRLTWPMLARCSTAPGPSRAGWRGSPRTCST